MDSRHVEEISMKEDAYDNPHIWIEIHMDNRHTKRIVMKADAYEMNTE